MKLKIRGWKEGIMIRDLKSCGDFVHRKGDLVRYKRKHIITPGKQWNGEYEYHYLDLNNYNLIRSTILYVEE